MNISESSKNGHTASFTVVIPAEEFAAAVEQAYEDNKEKYEVEGYDVGQAPLSVYREKYGETAFFQETLSSLAMQAYQKVLEELDAKVVGQPSVSGVSASLEDGASMTFTVTLYPDVKLGMYKGLRAEKRVLPVTDEEIEVELEQTRQKIGAGRMAAVEGRPAQKGDTVDIDFDGYLDGERFEGGKAEHYSLALGSGAFVPGFEEQVEGMLPGDEKDIPITFPENYMPDLAGKDVIFKIRLHNIMAAQVPELDDAFAKDASQGRFKTLEAYKADLRVMLAGRHAAEAEERFGNEILTQAIDNMRVEIPESMIQEQVGKVLQGYADRFGIEAASAEEVIQKLGITETILKENIEPQAISQLRSSFMLNAVAEAEGLTVSDEEIGEFADKIAQNNFGATREDVLRYFGRAFIKEEVLKDKAERLIVSLAEVIR
jgi:trigger factor